jgi:hypothetical protein
LARNKEVNMPANPSIRRDRDSGEVNRGRPTAADLREQMPMDPRGAPMFAATALIIIAAVVLAVVVGALFMAMQSG